MGTRDTRVGVGVTEVEGGGDGGEETTAGGGAEGEGEEAVECRCGEVARVSCPGMRRMISSRLIDWLAQEKDRANPLIKGVCVCVCVGLARLHSGQSSG